MTIFSRAALAGAAWLAAGVAASAAPQVTVSDAWFRALPAPLPAGGYFTLHNDGKTALSLTGAESAACGMLMLHKSDNANGMSSMMDVPAISVPAGGTIAFAPGSSHLMCTEPSKALVVGATVKVTLSFADGGKSEASFVVRGAGGK